MCSDDGAVDHVSPGVTFYYLGQCFEHRVEHPGLHPSAVAAKHAVPLAVLIGQVTPLRPCPGNPHHAFEIAPIISRRSAPATTLRGQQRTDDRPFLVRHANAFAQHCLQNAVLNQLPSPLSTFVHGTEHYWFIMEWLKKWRNANTSDRLWVG